MYLQHFYNTLQHKSTKKEIFKVFAQLSLCFIWRVIWNDCYAVPYTSIRSQSMITGAQKHGTTLLKYDTGLEEKSPNMYIQKGRKKKW